MKKRRIKIIGGITLSIMLAVAVLLSGCADNTPPTDPGDESGAPSSDYVYDPSVNRGKLIRRPDGYLSVGGEGTPLMLRGVNLGGWLIQENWMCPIEGADNEWANLNTVEVLEERGFSAGEIEALFGIYRDNWLTEADLDRIAAAGCNVVRVPFWYRNFMKNEQGDWIDDNLDAIDGFRRLDWVIAEAKERGMYVILDMHGVPGGQSFNHSCGTLGSNKIYSDPTCRQAMKKLWVTIAERYKNESAVAAYDIMNEPHNNDEAYREDPAWRDIWSPQSWEEYNAVYDEMIEAIRAVDPVHVITVEGIWRVSNLPKPEKAGWSNMMYQVHLYDDTTTFRGLAKQMSLYAGLYGVAGYVGEFSNPDGYEICEANDLHWTSWTYKGGKGFYGDWFWYYGSPEAVDPYTDDYDTIARKWGAAIRTETMQENSALIETIKGICLKAN